MTPTAPRAAVVCVLAAAALGGLLFTPVFGLGALAGPIAAVVLLLFAADEACRQWPVLTPGRPLLVLVAGLFGVVWTVLGDTTVAGLPSSQTLQLLVHGVSDSWQLTLQSTWPARPDPRLLLFVPLCVLLAGVLGVELLHRVRAPLVALLPGVAVVGLSQAYFALSGFAAVAVAVGFAVLAGVLMVRTRRERGPRRAVLVGLAVPAAVLGVVGALLLTAADPLGRQPYALKSANQAPPLAETAVASPLDELAQRLQQGDEPLFSYTADGPVETWTLAVLDTFDGVTWRSTWGFQRLGTQIGPGRQVTGGVDARAARITANALPGPWLPSQRLPATVSGTNPLVDPARGTLFHPGGAAGYRLRWWEPKVDPATLRDAAIDQSAPGGFGSMGQVPREVHQLAQQATGNLKRPSFRAALALEAYLRDHYLVAERDLPTGHGWPQLREFLLGKGKRGTSEQFAAAYVVLARVRGIPARLAVGFRAPAEPGPDGTFTVTNAQAEAWPEVAVAGVGWVPLDPTGGAARGGSAPVTGLAQATEQARSELPELTELTDPKVAPPKSAAAQNAGGGWPWYLLLAIVLGAPLALLLLLWLGVPVIRGLRAARRRRAAPAASVVGAWAEARDRLRAHGVPVSAGMTVRDLVPAAGRIAGPSTVDGLHGLAATVDAALWSGRGATEPMARQAWDDVRAVRRGLGQRPLSSRLRAAVDLRSLLPPRR